MNKILLSLLLLSVIFSPIKVQAKETKKPEKAILIVSFGTSMPQARKAIDNLVDATKKNFPDFEVRLAFSSNIIRRKIARENKEIIPNPPEALAMLNDENYSEVYVMPTHIIPGEEYDEIADVCAAFANLSGKYGFTELALGKPFLNGVKDCDRMTEILSERFKKYLDDKETAIVLMGHGTPEHIANAMYSQLQLSLDKAHYGKFFLGTVEAAPKIEDIIRNLKRHSEIKKLVISPFMIVAGDHANNDLADEDDEESWISILKSQGYENIEKYLVGLGEDENIKNDFVKRIRELTDD